MKKIIITVITVVMLFALCGCNNTSTDETENEVPNYMIARINTQAGLIRDSYVNTYDNIVETHVEVVDYSEGLVKICLVAPNNGEHEYYGRAYLWDVDQMNREQISAWQAYGNTVEETIDNLLAY